MDHLNEKCAVFGVFGKELDVSRLTFFGLFALQHRGQESSGIATSDGARIRCYRNVGLVTHAYDEVTIKELTGHIAIGHNRYSTSQGTGIRYAQPWVTKADVLVHEKRAGTTIADGLLAFAHNGNLPSVTALAEFLKSKGVDTEDLTDSQMMAEAVSAYLAEGMSVKDAAVKAFPLFTGAFSLVMMTKDTLVAMRDHCGIRPLSLAKLNGGYVIASETCAFEPIGAEFIRDIAPGEILVITEAGLESVQAAPANPKLDIFEFVYFARPDSMLMGKLVYEVRKRCGARLAKESPVQADIVVPVPETAIPVAIGYSHATGIPLEMALVKNRYIHRTFIQPDQHSRDLGVKMKLVPLPEVLKGKRVVVIDDSIVRGTTSRRIVQAIFEAGASEVHFFSSCPPVRYPDFYGIDTPKQGDFIAACKPVEDIRAHIGATSLHYFSLEGLIEAIGVPQKLLCTSCFTGEYPIDLRERGKEFMLCKLADA